MCIRDSNAVVVESRCETTVTLADAPSKADAAVGCRSERLAPVTKAAAPQATGVPMTTRIAAAATVLGTRREFDRPMVFSLLLECFGRCGPITESTDTGGLRATR